MQHKFIQYVFAFAVLCFGMHFFAFALTSYQLTYLPGDYGDTRLICYILEHGYQSIFCGNGSFWDAPYMYPLTNALALSDNLVGSMPAYALFRISGAERETAMQLWFVLMFVLNYCMCFWASLKFKNSIYISALIAYIYAFAMPVLAQANHCQLMPRFIVPFIFYFAYRFLQMPGNRYLWLLLLCCVYQVYCEIYIAALSMYVLFIFMIIHTTINKSWRFIIDYIRKSPLIIFTTLLITVVILYPIIIHYGAAREVLGRKTFDSIVALIPRMSSYLFAIHGAYVWSFLNNTGLYLPEYWEHYLFPGGMVFLSLFFILFARFTGHPSYLSKNKLYLSFAYTILLVIISTTIFKGFSLFIFTREILPGFESLRGVTRIIFPLLLLLAFMIAPFLEFIREKKFSAYWLALIIPFILAEQVSDKNKFIRTEKSHMIARTDSVLQLIDVKKIQNSSILVLTGNNPEEAGKLQIDGMMVSQQLGMPTVNGYSSGCPVDFGAFWTNPNDSTLRIWTSANPELDTNRFMIIKVMN